MRGRPATAHFMRGRRTAHLVRGRDRTAHFLRGRQSRDQITGVLLPVVGGREKDAAQHVHGYIRGKLDGVNEARVEVEDRPRAVAPAGVPVIDKLRLLDAPLAGDQLQVVEQRAQVPTLGVHPGKLAGLQRVVQSLSEDQSHAAQLGFDALDRRRLAAQRQVGGAQLVVLRLAQREHLDQHSVLPVGELLALPGQVYPETGQDARQGGRAQVQRRAAEVDLDRQVVLVEIGLMDVWMGCQ